MNKIILIMALAIILINVPQVQGACGDCLTGQTKCFSDHVLGCLDVFGDGSCFDWEFQSTEQNFCPFGCIDIGSGIAICDDSPSGCQDRCTSGEEKCEGNTVVPCTNNPATGCYDWSNNPAEQDYCELPSQCIQTGTSAYCFEIEPTPVCSDECLIGQFRCGNPQGVLGNIKYKMACGNYDQDSCNEYPNSPTVVQSSLTGFVECPFGCEDIGSGLAQCLAQPEACSFNCLLDSTQCDAYSGTILKCKDYNNDNCNEYINPSGNTDVEEVCELGCQNIGTGIAFCIENTDAVTRLDKLIVDSNTLFLWNFDQLNEEGTPKPGNPDETIWPINDSSSNDISMVLQAGDTDGNTNNNTVFILESAFIDSGKSLNLTTVVEGISFYTEDILTDFLPPRNGTIETWIYLKELTNIPDKPTIIQHGGISLLITGHGFTQVLWNGIENNVTTINLSDNKWHLISVTWGDYLKIYIDGNIEFINTSINGRHSDDISIVTMSGVDSDDTIYIDQIRYSNRERTYTTETSECDASALASGLVDTKCTGSYPNTYIIQCNDDNGDGIFEWSELPSFQIACGSDSICIYNTTTQQASCELVSTVGDGECPFTSIGGFQGECQIGTGRCVAERFIEYCVPAPYDPDCAIWNITNKTTCGESGSCFNGACVQCVDQCNITSSRCETHEVATMVDGTILKEEFIIPCTNDANFFTSQCTIWGDFDNPFISVTACEYGCKMGWNESNNGTFGECIIPDELIFGAKNLLTEQKNSLNILLNTEGYKMIFIFILMGVFIVLGTLFSEKMEVGLFLGFIILLFGIVIGWLPIIFTVLLIIFSGFMLMRWFFNGGNE